MKELVTLMVVGYFLYKSESLFGPRSSPGSGTHDIRPDERTYDADNYIVWADILESALGGSTLNENEEAVYDVLGMMRTDGDFHELVKVYGTRCFIVDRWNCMTLPQAIERYFNRAERNIINAMFESHGMSVRV